MKNIFTEHPQSVGETYFQHMKFALLFGLKMIVGGLACCVHAIFPFIFANTGSDMLLNLTQRFIERMPNMEDRILRIAKLIEEKQQKKS